MARVFSFTLPPNPYWLRCASSAMTTMFCRALSSGITPVPRSLGEVGLPFSGMNLWMVVNTTPPLARFRSARRCSRPQACTGFWPRISAQRSAPPASSSASPDAAPRAWRRRAWRNSFRFPACAKPRPRVGRPASRRASCPPNACRPLPLICPRLA